MRLRLIASVVVVATVLGGAWVGRDLIQTGSGGGWSHEAGEAFDAERVLMTGFERSRPNVTFLVQARIGDVDGRDVEAAVADFVERLEARPGITQIESYWSLGKPDWMRSDDGTMALIHARVGGASEDYAARADQLSGLLRTVDDTVRISLGGQVILHGDIQTAMQDALGPIAIVALLSLFFVFLALRQWVALALVATTSVLAVAITMLGLSVLASFGETPVAAVVFGIVSAWGLATGSGYLMLSRYLAEREAGAGGRAAVVATVGTAGRTVAIAAAVAAGTGAALVALPTALLRATGYALGLAGVAAGLSAIVVLGLLLAVVGVDVAPRRSAHSRWLKPDRVTKLASRRPLVTAVVLVAILVPLLVTSLGVRLGEPTVVSLGPADHSRLTAQQITAKFPSDDADAPFIVSPNVVDFRTAPELTAEYAAALSRIDGVARVDSDQGTFVDGARVPVPRAITSRHEADQRTWLQAPIAGFGGGASAEQVFDAIEEVMAPFRVVVGGTVARQMGTADSVSARAPIFAGIALLIVVALIAWLLRSAAAAIRGAVVILLITAAGTAVIHLGFARGELRTLLSFSSDGAVAAVGPPIAWVTSVGVAAAASVFAWGAIREVFDLTKDAATAAGRALGATRRQHLVASLLLLMPFFALLVNGWRTAKLVGAATIATGVAMMTIGRFVAIPAVTSIGVARLWPITRSGDVRRVYPSTPAGRSLVAEAEAYEAAEAEALAEATREGLEEAAAETPVPLVGADASPEPATPAATDLATGDALAAPIATESPAEPAEAPSATTVAPRASEPPVAATVGPEADDAAGLEASAPPAVALGESPPEPAAAGDASPDPPAAEAPVVPAGIEAEHDAAATETPDVAIATDEGSSGEEVFAQADAPLAAAAAEVVEPSFSDDAAAAPDELAVAAADELAVAPEVSEPAEPIATAAPSEPAAGTVDVASLTASVIAAIEPTTPFTTELNSAYVANPANNLSRVMEAILRDASSRGGDEVLVYGHASRDRYRWMVVDSGPRADADASRARTLAEAQRFIRRVGGVVECRPEGDFTVFVVEIPMAS